MKTGIYKQKMPSVEAWKFDGYLEPHWNIPKPVFVGEWIIRDGRGVYTVVTDKYFKTNYERVKE